MDYIRNPKPNGYRSYHILLSFLLRFWGNEPHDPVWLEVQLRTITMDCWTNIEHQLKYKQDIPNQALIVQKLKRCADEVNIGEDGIAITEVSRQQRTEQSAAKNLSFAPRMDTVEISAEGAAASAAMQEQGTSASSVEDSGTDDLSEYTDSELKQMYYRGEITLQEYEEETGEILE